MFLSGTESTTFSVSSGSEIIAATGEAGGGTRS
jgi:hypothetical protein